MTIPYFIVRAIFLIIADHCIVGKQLTYFSCEITVLVVNDVIVGTCTVELATAAEPSTPSGRWLLEPRPGVLVAVYADCVGEIS